MSGIGIHVEDVWVLGAVHISISLVTSIGLTIMICGTAGFLTRHMARSPGNLQVLLEAIVSALEESVAQVAGRHTQIIMPFIASLWIFLVCANITGLIPGLDSPTRDLSVTTALAIVVFLSVHWFGIRTQGLRRYLSHYLTPSPVLLPFHLMSEVTRTVALAVRLFGNMMSLEMAALLILMVAGFLVPIPILMLHIVEALVQAYIFGTLALIYVAGGIQIQEERKAE
jgi:F-type H+-transporting ATPase subunit a